MRFDYFNLIIPRSKLRGIIKLKVKTYVQIHRMVMEYWDQIAAGLDLRPISERQLRDRLKKICHHPRKPAAFIFQLFPELES